MKNNFVKIVLFGYMYPKISWINNRSYFSAKKYVWLDFHKKKEKKKERISLTPKDKKKIPTMIKIGLKNIYYINTVIQGINKK